MTDAHTPTDLQRLRAGFAHPPATARPMMRWWWFGPAVERTEIERELDAMAAAGFGGAELSVVYPLSDQTDSYLSEGFLADVRFAAEAARDRGLRFDLTLGSGWSFGGPHIDQETAARGLHWERQEVVPLATSFPLPNGWPGDEFIGAYIGAGSLQEPPDEMTMLEVVDGCIVIPAGEGPRVVFTAVSRLTGQNVKRAARGAEGPVFDHYSRAATESHIRAVCEPLIRAAGAELVGSVFCDSLETYGADWTPSAPSEFRERRGYDLLPELCLLEIDGSDSDRVRRDMYRTLTELYEQNFVATLQQWASGHSVPFRIQGYGEPPAAISSYRFADMIEGEGWGWKEVTQSRWATSAAHLYGKPVVSSEIWTWVHSPSFRATPLDLKGEAHEHLLIGINHFIGHGWPYSPPDAPGIGWMFYASGAIDDRNPWWPAMPDLTAYLHRLAWLMRQGDPMAQVAVYAPTDDAYAAMHSGGAGVIDLWRGTRARIGDEVPRRIRELGLDFDLIDDPAMAVTPPDRYAVVVLPNVTHLPDAASDWLSAVERAGGTVITVGQDPRTVGRTGRDAAIRAEEFGDALSTVAAAPLVLDPPSPEIGVVHRRVGSSDVHFLANTGGTVQTFTATTDRPRRMLERWEASDGTVIGRWFEDEPTSLTISLTLAAYEATVLVATDEVPDAAADHVIAAPSRDDSSQVPLDGAWTVAFDGEPPMPVVLPHRWEADGRQHYSGSATYSTTIDIPERPAHAWLDFGPAEPIVADSATESGIRGRSFRAEVRTPVGEVAVVTVNAVPAGIVWSSPYELDIGDLLVAGVNTIGIVVFNTAANALANDPTVAEWAGKSAERYGRRFRMQELDRAADGISSGLLAAPALLVTL